jgi:flagellar hook-associated protein 2
VLDGLTIERTTHEFNDVVTGVSITATSTNPDELLQFTVEADQTAIKKKLKDFVDAYNEVIEFVNQQNTYTEDVGPAGKLFGDPILSSVRSRIDGALFGVDVADVTADTLGFSTLNLVGIERQNDGTLLIDDTTLADKLAEDIDAFADLFVDFDGFDNGGADVSSPDYFTDTSADAGLAASLDRAIERMFDSIEGANGQVVKGLFDARNETWNADLRRFDRQIDAKEVYLERFEANLVQRFARLEELIGGLNAQGASLQAALGL